MSKKSYKEFAVYDMENDEIVVFIGNNNQCARYLGIEPNTLVNYRYTMQLVRARYKVEEIDPYDEDDEEE